MYNLTSSQALEAPKSPFLTNKCTLALLFVSLALFSGCSPQAQETEADTQKETGSDILANDTAKASYGMGYTLGENIKQQQAGMLDFEAFLLGAKDSLGDVENRLTEEELKVAFAGYQKIAQDKQQQALEVTMEAGQKFLAEVATRENVVSLESGLLYEVLTKGDGPVPTAEDKVRTHYHGTLIDGTVFDSSVDRGEPLEFPVTGVIKGWVEALQLMPVGSKWRLYVPPELAYGARGAGGAIGPNATLIFEVELLDIVSDK